MNYSIKFPDSLHAKIQLPSSKSISNRLLIMNALSRSTYPINNLSECDDTKVMKMAFSSETNTIDVQAAGTAMRFLTAYFAQTEGEWILTGTERMKQRPIGVLVDALRTIGAKIEYLDQNGYPPLKISGRKLTGGEIQMDGSVSSQFISALMMIAPYTEKGIAINFDKPLISEPYVDMTAFLMRIFDAEVSWSKCFVKVGPRPYHPRPLTVESDWSAASYWYESLSFASEGSQVELLGLNDFSLQGDAVIEKLFNELGVSTEFTEKGVILRKIATTLNYIEYNFIDAPDLAQTIIVTCALQNIPFRFYGLQSLKIKETDRIKALQDELYKLGYILHSKEDRILEWIGEMVPVQDQPLIKTYHDHRMAMAFAPVSCMIPGIRIDDPGVVSKSYPRFWENLAGCGFIISENNSEDAC